VALDRLNALRGAASVVGVGQTDYARDYHEWKRGDPPVASETYAVRALRNALEDAELPKDAIDGMVVSPSLSYERMAELAGINCRWSATGDAAGAIVLATMAIATGMASCVALVYGINSRSARRQYGGSSAAQGTAGYAQLKAYSYYAPSGLTSQGGFYALMTSRYLAMHGIDQEKLGVVARRQREYAAANPRAILRTPVTEDDYRTDRYITEPLRRMDYCLVNDGGAALLVTSAERAALMARGGIPVLGIGWCDLNLDATSLQPRLIDFYHSAHRAAAGQAYEMAGCGPADINCVQVYDSFSCHVPFALEGFGFCPDGEGLNLVGKGGLGPGQLAINTSGGHLAESYVHGWSHQVEAVRQLRGECGDRQADSATLAQYICDAAGCVRTIVYGGPDSAR
jgi:acetyl-CoA acetyltransferase